MHVWPFENKHRCIIIITRTTADGGAVCRCSVSNENSTCIVCRDNVYTHISYVCWIRIKKHHVRVDRLFPNGGDGGYMNAFRRVSRWHVRLLLKEP